MSLDKAEQELRIEKILAEIRAMNDQAKKDRVEISNLIALTEKARSENRQIKLHTVLYPVVVGAGMTAAIAGLVRLFLT